METSHDFSFFQNIAKDNSLQITLPKYSVLNNARASGNVDKYGGMVVNFEFVPCCVPVYRNFVSTQ